MLRLEVQHRCCSRLSAANKPEIRSYLGELPYRAPGISMDLQLFAIIILTFVIHLIGTLAFAFRIAGIRTGHIALRFRCSTPWC